MKSEAPKSGPTIPRRWRWHYRELLRRRDALLHERNERQADLRTHGGDAGDAGDAARTEVQDDELLAELVSEEHELAEVEAALERIQSNRYGRCELTGKPIPLARLRAVPWTRRAVADAEKRKASRP